MIVASRNRVGMMQIIDRIGNVSGIDKGVYDGYVHRFSPSFLRLHLYLLLLCLRKYGLRLSNSLSKSTSSKSAAFMLSSSSS